MVKRKIVARTQNDGWKPKKKRKPMTEEQRKAAADAARQRARDQIMQGVGTIGAAGMQGVKAGQANQAEGLTFFGKEKPEVG